MANSKQAIDSKTPPDLDEFVALVRAYVPTSSDSKRSRRSQHTAPASNWTLVFDTETRTDEAQSLRFGAYQLRQEGKLVEEGMFYDPEGVSDADVATLQRAASAKGALLMALSDFTEKVFFGKAYELRAAIVGFNLPFDLSRIAISHDSARGKMKGGFTFLLSEERRHPRVQVRHLSSRAALIQFTQPRRQSTPRGARKRGLFTPTRRGSFIDVKTLAAALLSQSGSLGSLANHLQTNSRKHETDEHGGDLTEAYVQYALQDVQVTWECYEILVRKYAAHGLRQPISKILSEASLGKAYLEQMGIRSFRSVQPDFPDSLLGFILSTYYGGRSEVRWRRTIKQVLYCDFLSMYPTVCTLMRLWRFVIAKGVDWRETTEKTQAFLNRVTLADLQRREIWPKLHTLVQLKPDRDILPLRARYDKVSPTIGLNEISSDQALWYTLADVVASKLLTGRVPKIMRAISFTPREPQDGLVPIGIGGASGEPINPVEDDFYRRLIDIRNEIKAKRDTAPERDRARLDGEQLAAKILANATSYGIFVEIIASELPRAETRLCFGPGASSFEVETSKSEEPGSFFHPLIATLITGAARLMLAMAETLAAKAGLDWAFCDTDSMAFTKPDEIPSEDFLQKAQSVARAFDELNPYAKRGPLLKIEEANFDLSNPGELQPLYAFCVSSKRYVLFNLAEDGSPVIRKGSAHGLGHLRAPYGATDAPKLIPAPSLPLEKIGIERWHYDLWFQIIKAASSGHAAEVDLTYHSCLSLPAMSRYAATTPEILGWMKGYNAGKDHRTQVKPFGFLSAFQGRQDMQAAVGSGRFKQRMGRTPKPIAPFSKDPRSAGGKAFDRDTGVCIDLELLKSYALALAQYHLSPETKFRYGNFTNEGRTERRLVRVVGISHIGKEASNLEKRFFLGTTDGDKIEYDNLFDASLASRLDERCKRLGERAVARLTRVSRTSVRKARTDPRSVTARIRRSLWSV